MENGSKALIIAGAILLVITIIAIAVGIVGKTRNAIDEGEVQIDAVEKKLHNDQFAIYEGRVTGAEVKDCIAKALSNNAEERNPAKRVTVQVIGTANPSVSELTINTTTTSFESNSINNRDVYLCSTTISTQGIITTVRFTRQ